MGSGKGKLTKKHGRVLLERLRGLPLKDIATREGITISSASERLSKISRYLHERTKKRLLKPPLTKRHGFVIRERLSGKSFSEIGSSLGISHQATRKLLAKAVPYLHEKTLDQLHLGTKEHFNSPRLREKIQAAFFNQLAASRVGYGIVTKTAKRAGLTDSGVIYHLNRAGINWRGEVQLKRFALAMRVRETLKKPHAETAELLGISKATLIRYRRLVREGHYLGGPLILVTPQAEKEWWPVKMPEVSYEQPSGPAWINMKVRNETVQKDLKLFDTSIKVAVQEARNWHPDNQTRKAPQNKAFELFQEAIKTRDALRNAKVKYIKKEREFRENYGLPKHPLIGEKEN